MKTYTIIDPCYIKEDSAIYMAELHGYAHKKHGHQSGDTFIYQDLYITYIRTGGDGYFHGCSVDTGALLIIPEPHNLTITVEPEHYRTNVTKEEAKKILQSAIDYRNFQEQQATNGRIAHIKKIKTLIKKWGRAGAEEILTAENTGNQHLLLPISFQVWHGKTLSDEITGTFLTREIAKFPSSLNKILEIHHPNGTIYRKQAYSRYITCKWGKAIPITKRAFNIRKNKLAKSK
jgi:hypothetical protein